MLLGTAATYGFVNYEFPYDLGRFHLPFLVLTTRFLPPIVTVIPLYVIFATANLLNTRLGLVLAYAAFNIPFVVWMLKGFFDGSRTAASRPPFSRDTELDAFVRRVADGAAGLTAATIFCVISAGRVAVCGHSSSNTEAQTLPVAQAT